MSQITLFGCLLAAFVGSFCLTYLYKNWATKRSILDIPNQRSSHEIPVPRGGGISFVLIFYVFLFIFYSNGLIDRVLFFSLLPGIGIAIIGIIDDFKSISITIRIVVQFVCAGIALFFLDGFDGFQDGSMKILWSIGMLFMIVWVINLFNFLDGIDGYASVEAIFISTSLCLFTGLDIFLILTFSVGGFLFWNWPKAKIFMGDVGSTILGYLLIILGIYIHNEGILGFYYWLILSSLFWFDATITLIRRILKHEHLNQAHKNHIYQRALQGKFAHQSVLHFGMAINILLFLVCFFVRRDFINWVSGLLLSLSFLWFIMRLVDKRVPYK